MEGQQKELKETLPSELNRLRMSRDGVRKYYGVPRRQTDSRLSVLEAGREGTETSVSISVEGRGLISMWHH